jgi:hypothetical protein
MPLSSHDYNRAPLSRYTSTRISEIRDLTSEKIPPPPLDTAAQIPSLRIYKSSVDA